MGKKVKVVLDTNVWVSILFKKALAGEFLPLIEAGRIDVYLSNQLLRELATVLTYPRIVEVLEKADVDPRTVLSVILKSAKLIAVRSPVNELRQDPADNRVSECASSAGAEFIVSGDTHLLSLNEFRGIRIVSPRDFLDIMKGGRLIERKG